MITIPAELKPRIVDALLEKRKNFDGTDGQFAKQFGINSSVYSRLKNSEVTEGLLSGAQWINIARELDIALKDRVWKAVRTDVFCMIEEDVIFCKTHSKSFILIDDNGIGKTFAGKYLARTLKNCFYVDASQCTTKSELIRTLAKTLGIDEHDKLSKIRANIKYVLKMLPNPIVIIDEAGALEDKAAMLIKELWNATEGLCGWYLMGADGLREKMERNLLNKKVGWSELFSRFNEKYNSIVPTDKSERLAFYKKLIADVLAVNMKDKSKLSAIVKKCLTNDSGRISGLRRAETLLLLENAA